MKNKPPSEKDKGMKKKIFAVFTAGVGIWGILSGCLPAKQVINGYEDPPKRVQIEEVRKSGDQTEESKKMEAQIRKLEEAEKRLQEMERKNQDTLRRLEEASKRTERSMERIEKAGEKMEAVGRKETR
jgi:TolA-binding protein